MIFCLVAKTFVEFILLGIKKKYMYRERSVAHYGDEGTLCIMNVQIK